MYDFKIQKEMMHTALILLKDKGLLNFSALGGGTALSAYYWNHRYSTDIDIFVHSKDDISSILRPSQWNQEFINGLEKLGYSGDVKIHPVYTEIVIKDDLKIQFFSVVDKTKNPYSIAKLWDKEFQIESIEEIIAKKIYYRAYKGNARDLYDIAVSLHKNPNILDMLNIPISKIKELQSTIFSIKEDNLLKKEYLYEIKLMKPSKDYLHLALETIDYLYEFIENYCGSYNMGIKLNEEEFIEIEKSIYSSLA